jgi:type VI secretion system secreted protein VgrG
MPTAAAARMASEPEFELHAGSYTAGELSVLSFEASEEISRPYEVEVLTAFDADQGVEPATLAGEAASLVIHLGDGTDRLLNGIVSKVESWEEGGRERRGRVRLRIVPRLWKLGQTRQSRIFQAKSVPEIVKHVLAEGGVDVRDALAASYAPRAYCVQYGESDLDFVSRLLEEVGIFFFFEHEPDKHVLVLADANSACADMPGDARLVFREPSSMAAEQDHLDAFSARLEIRPGTVSLRDFNFLRPSVDLTAQAKADADQDLEVYDYPGGYDDGGAGKALAKARLEELRAGREVMAGAGTCRRVAAGFRFGLDEHPIAELNDKYLALAVRHRGRQIEALGAGEASRDGPEYRSDVRAIRASVPYRPERRTERPTIPGPQTAIVVGPSGEEIFCDAHGRVKVQFHWDRTGSGDDRSSCWIRVSQAWAGPGWGALYLPRIGQEVVVEFLEGDPDRPLITGAVYNGMNPPPVALPGEKTKSTLRSASSPGGDGFNELRFEDAKGSEEVFLHAQRDLKIVVENDKTQSVGANESLRVGGDRAMEVAGNQALQVGKDDSTTVGANQVVDVGADRSVTVGGSHTESIGIAQSLTVGAAQAIAVGGAASEMVGGAKQIMVGAAMALTVGAALVEVVGGSRTETVGENRTESVGGNKTESVGGGRTVKVGEDLSEEVGGNKTLKIGKDLTVNVAGKLQHTVAKEYVLKAKKVTLSAEDEMTLKVGSATLSLKKSGDVVVKGGKVQVKASGDVVLKGSKISQN